MRDRKLVVLTEIIAPYRIPVFNALARQQGIDLHVIFLSETDPTLRQWKVYKEEIEFSYVVLSSYRSRVGKYNVMLNWGLADALKTISPDVVLCGGYNYIASWQALRWCRKRKVPFLLWVESNRADARNRHEIVESLKKNFVGSCDGFVVPGRSALEYLTDFQVNEQSIFTAPNAVDVDYFRNNSKKLSHQSAELRQVFSPNARFFLFAGRLVSEKGVFDLLDAYGTLDGQLRRDVGLVFAGDGGARVELERCAARISPGNVKIMGFLQREQLATLYGLAETFVFPTHSDPWGLAVNEAMSCGLPVISTVAAGCAMDLVRDGWNGRVVETGDVEQLAKAMTEMATHPELRKLMGQRSCEIIRGYSPQACAVGIAQAVEGVSQ